MKAIFMGIAILAALTANSQSARYNSAMEKFTKQLDTAKTAEDYQQSANNFERIAAAESDQWLPHYYVAFATIMQGFSTKDNKVLDGLANKADDHLGKAESMSANNSEITTLKAMVFFLRMNVDQSRGMTMGPRATALLQEALKQTPSPNPRALAQMAQMKFYTPAAFGGSKEDAIKYMRQSIAAYEAQTTTEGFMPRWGKSYAEMMLKEWSK